MGPYEVEKSVEEEANENEVIDLRDGGGWKAGISHEEFPDSND